MSGHRLVTLVALACVPGVASAEDLPDFDSHQNTWHATHIVLVDGETVVESWAGDLRPGSKLPEGAARFARLAPPTAEPPFGFAGKPPTVSGKRRVLFLAHVPQRGGDPEKLVWSGADSPGDPRRHVSETAVAWVEGDEVYTVHQPVNPGGYVLTRGGNVARLKQEVDLGLALRAQFAAAKADPDPARRADRLAVLEPFLSRYAPYPAGTDCVDAVRGCGKAGAPYLARWAAATDGYPRMEAIEALFGLGNTGFDAAMDVLADRARYWARTIPDLRPVRDRDKLFKDRPRLALDEVHLVYLLRGAQRMILSRENRDRLVNHPALKELDEALTAEPALRPEKSSLAEAYRIVREIRAGKLRPGE